MKNMTFTTIIAEAGINHNGSIKKAKSLIDVASEAGADFVKFQTFKAKDLLIRKAEKAPYQKILTDKEETQYEMLRKLELDEPTHKELMIYCKKKGIGFLSSAFSHESIDFLDDLGIEMYKIPSGEITNLPYLRHISLKKKPLIISTGMADLEEISNAIEILTNSGTKKEQITILQCNSEYPTPVEDVNLKAMLTIRDEFEVDVGYSDHTLGIEIPIAAAALGAKIIEKHFTLDRSLSGPDHLSSLEPEELVAMVAAIRKIGKAMGTGVKSPSNSEKKNIRIVRKSIVTKRSVKKGELFSAENITVKRPGTGISPMEWDKIIGKKSKFNFKSGDFVRI